MVGLLIPSSQLMIWKKYLKDHRIKKLRLENFIVTQKYSPIPFVLLGLCLVAYLTPQLRSAVLYIDEQAFYLINGSLRIGYYWQLLWFALNHNYEKTLNLVVFLSVSLFIILNEPKRMRKKLVINVVSLIIFMQFAFLIKDAFFVTFLELKRQSPSQVLHPFINLSELFATNNVKIASGSSFPGGHAFSAAFWAIFTCGFANKKYWPLVWFVAIPIIVNRLFSGAHWLSDVVVGVLLAWVMVVASYWIKNKLISAINRN